MFIECEHCLPDKKTENSVFEHRLFRQYENAASTALPKMKNPQICGFFRDLIFDITLFDTL